MRDARMHQPVLGAARWRECRSTALRFCRRSERHPVLTPRYVARHRQRLRFRRRRHTFIRRSALIPSRHPHLHA